MQHLNYETHSFYFAHIFPGCCFYRVCNHHQRSCTGTPKLPGLPTESQQTISTNITTKPPQENTICSKFATLICTAQIKTSCLKLHHYMYTCDPIWPIRRSVAAFTAQMCCQREGLIKVTLMEMQLITAPCWRQGESVAGNMWRTRCGTGAGSH